MMSISVNNVGYSFFCNFEAMGRPIVTRGRVKLRVIEELSEGE